jgi:alkyldihydroxyacetonephosphate synthase
VPNVAPALRALPALEPDVAAPEVTVPDALAAFATQTPRERAMHARGRAFPDLAAGFAGDYAGAPDIVVRPRDADEVARVLDICASSNWACVPFGGGTSVVGGVDTKLARGSRGAVVSLDLGALAGVREVDASDFAFI